MIAFTQQVAIQNAEYGIRANVILPGLMDTPMAVDTRARAMPARAAPKLPRCATARVPLRRKMGTAWDVANAALFLASDEANFITGVQLPVKTAARWSISGIDRTSGGILMRRFAFAVVAFALQFVPASAQDQWREFRADGRWLRGVAAAGARVTSRRIKDTKATQSMFLIEKGGARPTWSASSPCGKGQRAERSGSGNTFRT